MTPPVSLVSIKSMPSPCLCQNCLPARWCSAPVFYLRHGCISKPHISETPKVWTHTDPLQEAFPALWPVLTYNRRQWHDHLAVQSLQWMATHSQHQVLQPSAKFFVPVLVDRAVLWFFQGPLPSERLLHLSQMHSNCGLCSWSQRQWHDCTVVQSLW